MGSSMHEFSIFSSCLGAILALLDPCGPGWQTLPYEHIFSLRLSSKVLKTQELVADGVELAHRKVNNTVNKTASTVLETVGDIANIRK